MPSKPPSLRSQIDAAWDAHQQTPTAGTEANLYGLLLKMANAEARRRFGGVNEDVGQIALVKLLEALKTAPYAGIAGAKFSTWAERIVGNEVSDEFTKESKRKKIEGVLNIARHGGIVADPGLKVEAQERAHALEASKGLLPPRQRQVVEGMLLGKSGRELADELGISQQAVTKLWKKALRKVGDGR